MRKEEKEKRRKEEDKRKSYIERPALLHTLLLQG
jgi:hypothetical protein